jgi:two-component system invasion response regulator UvrY
VVFQEISGIFSRLLISPAEFGYVTKASAPHVLVEAVHAVAAGRAYLSPEPAQKLYNARPFGSGVNECVR